MVSVDGSRATRWPAWGAASWSVEERRWTRRQLCRDPPEYNDGGMKKGR
jgi:hypothetical protein